MCERGKGAGEVERGNGKGQRERGVMKESFRNIKRGTFPLSYHLDVVSGTGSANVFPRLTPLTHLRLRSLLLLLPLTAQEHGCFFICARTKPCLNVSVGEVPKQSLVLCFFQYSP